MQKIFAPCPEFSYSYPTDFFYTRSVALNFSSTCSADASDSSVAYVRKKIALHNSISYLFTNIK